MHLWPQHLLAALPPTILWDNILSYLQGYIALSGTGQNAATTINPKQGDVHDFFKQILIPTLRVARRHLGAGQFHR